MRVLTISNLYPPHALGGYEMSCDDVMRRWVAEGHDVRVLTTDTELPAEQRVASTPSQVPVTRTLRWYWRDHEILQPGLTQRRGIERHNRRVLRQALAERPPDVVSVWSMGAMSLGLIDVLNRSGVPVVYVVCDEWPVYGPRLDAWSARGWGFGRRRVPAPRRATFCWLSEFVRRRVIDATGWVPARETVTYSGIDADDFPFATPRERAWQWNLLCVGRVEPRKGFATAVEALARLPATARLRIAGPDNGTHAAELRRLADSLGVGDRVTIEAAARAQVREVYAAADALLFTSAWEEPFGLVPLEAMACATPVVAAPTGGAREYLVDGMNCVAVPPGDPEALAKALCDLAADAPLRSRLVSEGLATAARFTSDRLAATLEKWHQAAAGGVSETELTCP